MMSGLPQVSARNRFRSLLSRQIRPVVAADDAVVGDGGDDGERLDGISHRHRRPDRRVRLVALDRDVLVAEIEDRAHRRVQPQARQRPRLARELEARLLQVVQVEMRVAEGVHEVAGLEGPSPAPSCA